MATTNIQDHHYKGQRSQAPRAICPQFLHLPRLLAALLRAGRAYHHESGGEHQYSPIQRLSQWTAERASSRADSCTFRRCASHSSMSAITRLKNPYAMMITDRQNSAGFRPANWSRHRSIISMTIAERAISAWSRTVWKIAGTLKKAEGVCRNSRKRKMQQWARSQARPHIGRLSFSLIR